MYVCVCIYMYVCIYVWMYIVGVINYHVLLLKLLFLEFA